ncbi:hypothetical protein, partial [Chroococcidiopsis sp. CCALA 051]|uniref:hypothetical protein n=1 Tax=Chroococcidiopsis sp. CCALA 051 TaxID=869949 RepID=UPI001E3DF768
SPSSASVKQTSTSIWLARKQGREQGSRGAGEQVGFVCRGASGATTNYPLPITHYQTLNCGATTLQI